MVVVDAKFPPSYVWPGVTLSEGTHSALGTPAGATQQDSHPLHNPELSSMAPPVGYEWPSLLPETDVS